MFLSSHNHTGEDLPSLARFLTLRYSLIFVGLLAMLFVGLYLSVSVYLQQEMEQDLLEDLEEYQAVYQQKGAQTMLALMASETEFGDAGSEFIRLFNADGIAIYESDLRQWQALRNTMAERPASWSHQPRLEKQSLESHDAPIQVLYGQIGDGYTVQIGESTEHFEDIMELLQSSFAIAFIVSVPLAAFGVYLFTRKTARHISGISEAAYDMGNGDFSRRVKNDSHIAETHNLAVSFNQMADKVQLLIREMREMTDNIAHDLRSPLGRIRAIAEMSLTSDNDMEHYRTAMENTLLECDRLLGLINTTLDVAEAEAGIIRSEYQPFDLSHMIRDVMELFEAAAEQKNLACSVKVMDDIMINGSKGSIQRMIANLIDNAIKYTDPGGSIRVTASKEQNGICIIVSDTGVGIPSDEQNRVFERFFRCDQSRSQSGSGLGLSYSRAVAKAHGGDITVQSEPKKYTAFKVMLPS